MRLRRNRFRMPNNRGDREKRHHPLTARGTGDLSFFRPGSPQHRRDTRPSEDTVEALKGKARAMEARLRSLSARIREMEQGYTAPKVIALVDEEKCVGCGLCQDNCPTGAVVLGEVARIDPKRCIGCGLCAERCPQGAISLRSAETGFKEHTEGAL